ncbi:MAG: hypothetical protein WD066_11315 [Planctomycetaceae bacterium]
MHAVEFTAELGPERVLTIPDDAAAQLPKAGRVRIIILSPDDPGDAEWRMAAYEQFLRDDAPEDEIYDSGG